MVTCPRRRVSAGLAVAAVLVATSVCAAGCTGQPDPDLTALPPPPAATTGVSPTPQPAVTTRLTDAARCTGAWTTPLVLRAQSADEVPYLSAISACTTDAGDETELINDSDVVWDIDTDPGGMQVTYAPADWQPSIFRASKAIGLGALLEPHSSVSVSAPPAATSWFADPAMTVLWTTQDTLISATDDEATDRVKNVLPELFSPNSERGKAWIVCGLAAYDAAKVTLRRSGGDGPDIEDVASLLKDAKDLGQSGLDCSKQIEAADEQDLAAINIESATLPRAEKVTADAHWESGVEDSLHEASTMVERLHLHL